MNAIFQGFRFENFDPHISFIAIYVNPKLRSFPARSLPDGLQIPVHAFQMKPVLLITIVGESSFLYAAPT
jgi:hypothetical protein